MFCPKRPTDGYCRTILEHHGIRARGVELKYAEMLKILKDLGYEVEIDQGRGKGRGSREGTPTGDR